MRATVKRRVRWRWEKGEKRRQHEIFSKMLNIEQRDGGGWRRVKDRKTQA